MFTGRITHLPEQTPVLLESDMMAASLTDAGSSFGDSSSPLVSRCRNSSMEDDDDDVVFIESIHPPSTSAPAIADPRNFVFASSRNEKLQGNNSTVLPSSRDLASQKGNISETIVIDDEEDMETNGGEGKHCSSFIEWGPPETKNRTSDVDFSTSGLSRSKTKTGVGPFNPGRMNVAGDVFQNGESATHHNPDSWISQSASFPRNQKQPGVDSLSPVASLPKQIFQPSAQQQPTKPVKVTCANCKKPLQKGQTAYQRKGSAHLFCSTSCLSSFSRKPALKKRSAVCKKDAPTKRAPVFSPLGSSDSFRKHQSTSRVSPDEDSQDLRKRVLNKSRCTICGKLTEVRHEVSVNNVTHKLCSNDCFNRYRMANGLIMNCCEQCGEYLPSRGARSRVLVVDGQQKRFCCQSCVSEYTQYRASVKRRNTMSPGGSAKIRRKAIDLEMKMKIVNAYEAGRKVKEIARDLELAHSTVSTILKDKDRVKEAAKASVGFKTVITRQRKGLIHEMEKLLAIWFDDQVQKRMPMSLLVIQAKARSIFRTLKEREGEKSSQTFTASHGWFQRFCRRFNLHNRSVRGEVASAKAEAAEKLVDQLDKIIKEGSYRPEHVSGEPADEGLRQSEVQQHLEEEAGPTEAQKKFTATGLAGVFSKVSAAVRTGGYGSKR